MRRTFIQWFAIALAVCIAGFLATINGAPLAIWRADQSYVTSAILAFFIGSSIFIGLSTWRSDPIGVAWGYHAANISMLLGMAGTITGISLQAKAVAAGLGGLAILGTSLFPTLCGLISAIILSTMAYNLENGAD